MDWLSTGINNLSKLEIFYNTHIHIIPAITNEDGKSTESTNKNDFLYEYQEMFVDLISDILANRINSAEVVAKFKTLSDFKTSSITQDTLCDSLWIWGSQVSESICESAHVHKMLH